MVTAQKIYDETGLCQRIERSFAYKHGVLTGLRNICRETDDLEPPWPYGTAECDAFMAGIQEAALRWQMYLKEQEITP